MVNPTLACPITYPKRSSRPLTETPGIPEQHSPVMPVSVPTLAPVTALAPVPSVHPPSPIVEPSLDESLLDASSSSEYLVRTAKTPYCISRRPLNTHPLLTACLSLQMRTTHPPWMSPFAVKWRTVGARWNLPRTAYGSWISLKTSGCSGSFRRATTLRAGRGLDRP